MKLRAVIHGLPARYEEKGFREYNPRDIREEKIKERLIKFVQDPGKKTSLVLTGSYGTGKTHLAVAVLKNLLPVKRKVVSMRMDGVNPDTRGYGKIETEILEPHRCIFLSADEFFQQLNDCISARASKEKKIRHYVRTYDTILLDDLRTENFSAARAENLYLFINRVYLDKKRIIITTNISMGELEKFEPRSASRLSEISLLLKFEGKDYRKG